MEQLGGPPTPGVGWAAGIERILLASGGERHAARPRRCFVAMPKAATAATAFGSLRACARRACRRRWSRPGRSLKGQLKQADRLGARWTVIVEDDGIELKDMESGEQRPARRATSCWSDAGEAAAPEPLPRPLGRPAARRRRRRELRVAGWVHRRRDHGGLIFIDLRDRTGLLQLVFRPEEAAEAHGWREALRAEDVITAAGELVAREEGAVNPNLPTGEVELNAREVELLADAETPPFQVDEDGSEADEDLRLQLPLPRPAPRARCGANFELRHDVITGDPRPPERARASSRSRRRS